MAYRPDPQLLLARLRGEPRHLPGQHDQSTHGHGAGGVRRSLADAKTIAEVSAVVAGEASHLTGHTVVVDMSGSDVQIAREHGEGLLRCVERYPRSDVREVYTYGPGGANPHGRGIPGDPDAYASATSTGRQEIGFNTRFAGDPQRYRAALELDGRTGFSVRGGPETVAMHEFGHQLSRQTGSTTGAYMAAADHARSRGLNPVETAKREVSIYATSSRAEFTAEAFADVMANGDAASPMSHAAVGEINSRYDAMAQIRGLLARTAWRHLPGKHNQKDHGRRGGVRASLNKAKTTDEIAAVISSEASAIIGDHVEVSMDGADPQVAREFGEGILQGVEKYPATPLRQVGTYGLGTASANDHNAQLLVHDSHSYGATAVAIRGGETNGAGGIYQSPVAHLPNGFTGNGTAIYLNARVATPAHFDARKSNMDAYKAMKAAGTIGGGPGNITVTARDVALHEFGHSIGKHGRPSMPEYEVRQEAERLASSSGTSLRRLVGDGVSLYAGTDDAELSAEVFADVMINGSKASSVSKQLFKVFDTNVRGWEAEVMSP